MTRRQLGWTGTAVLFLLAIAGLWTIQGTHSISLTEDEVQTRVNAKLNKDFTVSGPAGLVIRTVAVQGATLHIADGQVNALIDIEGTLRTGKRFTLTAYAVGLPAYADGAFYFKPRQIEVQRFAYVGSAPNELFARFSRRYVTDDKLRQAIETKDVRVEEWMTAIAQTGAMLWLDHRPVYRPKDDVKGLLIRASLDAVKIEQDRIVLTFTLWQLTLGVVLGLLALVAGICMTMALSRFWLFRIA